ncbi:MAG: tRNA adenosine(34) deaminase TadA [Acidobacteria bacterium]|nr:tRNA adenosine(34) deaminase TadA [Acidobacteriota bacterium]
MRRALQEAETARGLGEVPIGACIVSANDGLLASGHNLTITRNDPTAHAEIVAIRNCGAEIANYRLIDTTIYTTIEPCVMCAGALVNARIKRLVYGAADERFGAVETLFGICDDPRLNHRLEITSGILADECRRLIQQFFKKRRSDSS